MRAHPPWAQWLHLELRQGRGALVPPPRQNGGTLVVINLERDAELEDELAAAFASWESKRPRNIQVQLGPSSLGACREYIRATIAGDEGVPERPRGLDGANVGTLLGEALEQIFSAEMGMASQVPITLVF